MAQKTLTARLKQRYDTATNWTTNNPVLLAGELGFESDTRKFKLGDGTTAWNSLSYIGSSGSSIDVQVNGTSITSNNVANLITNTAYNASTNKLATMSDIPTETDPVFSASASAGITSTDISNWNDVKINASGTNPNYIKYENGMLVYWGYYDNGSNVGDKQGITVNFSVPFVSTPSFVATSGRTDNTASYRTTYCNYYNISTTSVTFGWYGNTARSAGWVAIGKWK